MTSSFQKNLVDKCQEAIHKLYHYLDGELTEEKRQAIEKHLDQCRPCEQAYSFERELRRVIADRMKEEVPESLKKKIADLIQHEFH